MRLRQKVIVTLILVGIISLTLISTLVHLLTESWWFNSVGFEEVFWTTFSLIFLGLTVFFLGAACILRKPQNSLHPLFHYI